MLASASTGPHRKCCVTMYRPMFPPVNLLIPLSEPPQLSLDDMHRSVALPHSMAGFWKQDRAFRSGIARQRGLHRSG